MAFFRKQVQMLCTIDQKLVYAAAKARGRHFVFTHQMAAFSYMTSLPSFRNYDVKMKSLIRIYAKFHPDLI